MIWFFGSLAMVTTLSYHNYKTAITHNQLTLSIYKTAFSKVSLTMNTTDCRSRLTSQLLTDKSITNLLYVGLTRTAEKTPLQMYSWSRDSAVGIATGYGMDDWEVGVWVPVGSRIFTSPCCPDRLWGPPNLLYNGYQELFPGGKAAGAWSWPLTSN
jgi:hypothetical protein